MVKKKKEVSEKDLSIYNNIQNLEQFYNNGKIEDLLQNIEAKKESLVEDMIEYANKHTEACKWDKEGMPLAYEVKINPLVVSNYFFKPIIPIGNQEPVYNAEKLSMVFDYYCEILAQVNDTIGYYPSSLTLFCKFAGITLSTLRQYKVSSDYGLRTVVEKIYDQVGDENITMSQMGMVREKSTIFKMKTQNELIEKEQPKININITEKPDLTRINERLSKYSYFANKKDNKNGK